MSEITVFNYSDYRTYIEKKIKTKEFGRGGKAKMAVHLGCQPSFVSQVLKGKSSFSLEQGFKLNSFFRHNTLMKDYFMVLIERDRAGTFELQKYFESKQKDLLEKSKLIENQMEFDQISEGDAMVYYSNWNHVLVRNLIDIPKYKNTDVLREKLNLNKKDMAEVLDFLLKKDLVVKDKKGLLQIGHKRLHIKKGSPVAKFGNITTRLEMIKNLEKESYDSIHYTCNMTLAKNKLEEFKKRFVTLIAELNEELNDEQHESETMATLVVDFAEV